MIKKCIGCGVVLQDTDKNILGYTPNIKNDYCMRCFRLKNYGEKDLNEVVNEEKIISKVNRGDGLAFFLIDYLNLNKYTLDIFNKIKIPKVLVISKVDVLRKEMKFQKIKIWLKKVYKIDDDIIFISNKNNFKNVNIFKYMDKFNIKTSYIMGITNAGKSTFINSILKAKGIKKEIVTSNKPNTTLDFIKLRIEDYTLFDTPGFLYLNLNKNIVKNEIKPITFNITKETTIIINEEIKLYFLAPNSVTIYTTDNNIKRVFRNDIKKGEDIQVFDNCDLVLPGIGFVNVKKAGTIKSSIPILEVRESISGCSYE